MSSSFFLFLKKILGKTANSEQAEEVHSFIRDYLKAEVSKEASNSVRIIYGGKIISIKK